VGSGAVEGACGGLEMPSHGTLAARVKSYVIRVAAWFVFLTVTAATAQLVSADRVQSFNQSVVDNIANWRPTQLARVYDGELLNGGIFALRPLGIVKRIPPLFFGVAVVNIPLATVTTAKRYIFNGGTAQRPVVFTLADDWTRAEIPTVDVTAPVADAPPNPIVGLLGLAIGVLSVLVFFRYRGGIGGFGFWAAIFLLAPLSGSLIMSLIGVAMVLTGMLLGGILTAVKAVTAFAAAVPLLTTLMTAMFKPIAGGVEERVVDSIANRMKG
jgi:hypothetical protein